MSLPKRHGIGVLPPVQDYAHVVFLRPGRAAWGSSAAIGPRRQRARDRCDAGHCPRYTRPPTAAGRKEEISTCSAPSAAHVVARILRAERGQGTVEYVGIVLAVAALLVAVAAAIDNKVGGPIATALVHRLQEAVDAGRQRQARLDRAGRAGARRRAPRRIRLLLGDELGGGSALGGLGAGPGAVRAARQRQRQRERGAAAGALADDERAAHRLRELRGDGKAEADAMAHVARHERPQDRDALRLRECPGPCRSRSTCPTPLAERHVDGDLAAGGRRVQRVRDEVRDDLQDAVAVAEHDGLRRRRARAA